MHDLKDIIENLQNLYENNSSLAALKDFERVLDESNLYVYKNWIDGELAYGPTIDRHWITLGLMWLEHQMPDPDGGKRLCDLGCKIYYKKSHLIQPRPILKQSDIRPGTKKGKLDHIPIWIVEIQMPKKLAFDIYRGYMDKMKNEQLNSDASLKASNQPLATQPVPQPVPQPAPPSGNNVGGA